MKGLDKRRDIPEKYETHYMSDLSVIFHVDRVRKEDKLYFNRHENIEILYFLEGQADIYCDDCFFVARKGEMVVFPSGCLHAIAAEDALYECLIVDRGLCLSAGVDTGMLYFEEHIVDENLASLYKKVAKEVGKGEPKYRTLAVRGAVLSLVAYLCRHYAERKEEKSRADLGIDKALRYVKEHLSEDITVDRLATVAGFSKYHFVREFKRVTSYTVVTYINLARIEHSKELLAQGEMTVGEIAFACGFNNLSYFSKTFRAHTGMTPSEYVAED
ncbi:MAG: helix-turn-helix transcriptional regulator [Clostridia bacterium]|nr:helix-turn-helix transcriptional regulator [Clostridia bacterium]